jgi:cyclic beta-1,2-glucan synthetase
VILWRLALTNRTSASRDCAVTGYVEWTLGDTRERTAPHIVTRLDERGVLLATNPIRESGGERVAFFQISERDGRACADRGLFLGRNGRYDSPAGLAAPTLPQRVGAGLDPCGAIQTRVSVAAGETHELVFAIGEAADAATAVSLAAAHCSPAAFTSALGHQKETWSRITGALQVATPDPGFDVLVNDWLLYQTLSCRIWGRTAFYQSSGAFGFRDQLQDVLALCLSRPDIARAHLLRAASHQFVEGDVQHWWHEPTVTASAPTSPTTGSGSCTRRCNTRMRPVTRACSTRWCPSSPGGCSARRRRALRSGHAVRPAGLTVRALRTGVRPQPGDRRARPAAHRHGRLE